MRTTMTFRFDEKIADYLRGTVKALGVNMTEYVESLIAADEGSRDELQGWDVGCVVCGDVIYFLDKPYYQFMVDAIQNGTGITAVIPDSVVPVDECLQLAKLMIRKQEDIVHSDSSDSIESITVQESAHFINTLQARHNVNLRDNII